MDSSTASPPRDQSQPKQPRRFNRSQRAALYLAAQGVCSECGKALSADWHADHIIPYSKDGSTDVANGQALCPECNLKKGAAMPVVSGWPGRQTPRAWQERAVGRFEHRIFGLGKKDFLCVATPGAGKTDWALAVARRLIADGEAKRVIIVCPTAALQGQWSKRAAGLIEIHDGWKAANGAVPDDVEGIAVTYQAVSFAPDSYRWLCRVPSVVIFDEIHHAGEDKRWGDALRHAFEPAVCRIALSGTPFRSDKNPIPFIDYQRDESGTMKSVADFSYSYAHALADSVCRPVLFPSFEGRMEWLSHGNIESAAFSDEIAEDEKARRLLAALDLRGDWLETVLREADDKLTEVRLGGHVDAGGLVIAINQEHARGIADLLYRATGERAAIAISEDPNAGEVITTFGTSARRWIVAVKMISEGVDIKRLRVGVYATTTTTELFFRQAVGRFVRWIDGLDEQSAYLFLPRDDRLLLLAEQIKVERDHQFAEEIEEIKRESESESSERVPSDFKAISAEDATPDDVIYDGDRWGQDVLSEARKAKQDLHIPEWYPDTIIAAVLRYKEQQFERTTGSVASTQSAPQETIRTRKSRISKTSNALVARYSTLTGMHYREIHQWLNGLVGCVSVKNATEDQLVKRLDILQRAMQEAERGHHVTSAQ